VLAAVAVRPMAMGVEASLEVLALVATRVILLLPKHRIPARIAGETKV
jgi:hypothetical protein